MPTQGLVAVSGEGVLQTRATSLLQKRLTGTTRATQEQQLPWQLGLLDQGLPWPAGRDPLPASVLGARVARPPSFPPLPSPLCCPPLCTPSLLLFIPSPQLCLLPPLSFSVSSVSPCPPSLSSLLPAPPHLATSPPVLVSSNGLCPSILGQIQEGTLEKWHFL